MPIKMLSLSNCPFCKSQNGEINLDTSELIPWRAAHPGGGSLLIHNDPDQNILSFNSEGPQPCPCEHMLYMQGDIAQSMKATANAVRSDFWLDFDFCHPAFDGSASGMMLSSFLFDVALDRRGPKQFLPKSRLVEDEFGQVWADDNEGAATSDFFEIEGSVVFAEDVAGFIAEVPKLARAREAWIAQYLPGGVESLNISYEIVETGNASLRSTKSSIAVLD